MLYLKEGKPVIKFLSIESPESADAAGIHKSIKTAFERFGILDANQHLIGLNVDGASVMTREHRSKEKIERRFTMATNHTLL